MLEVLAEIYFGFIFILAGCVILYVIFRLLKKKNKRKDDKNHNDRKYTGW